MKKVLTKPKRAMIRTIIDLYRIGRQPDLDGWRQSRPRALWWAIQVDFLAWRYCREMAKEDAER